MLNIHLMDVVKAVYAIDYTAKDRTISVSNVEFDSRKVQPGSLFVPLKGTTDGHDYVRKAIENGAVATLWDRNPQEAPTDEIACIFVDDTLESFHKLATYYRKRINPIVIGITGSNGKTTTKDMTATTLAAKYRVHKTQGNYNNEIGLPYTILKMPEDTQVLVLEMGMSGFDEIALLSRIAEPDMAAITVIGESHLEHLGSRQGIAQAKLEIVTGLKPGGLLVYPGNEPLLIDLLSSSEQPFQTKTIGFDEQYDVYAYDILEEQNKTYFKTNVDDNIVSSIPVIGAYNVSNALIALTFAQALAVPIEQAIFQLAQFELTAHRLEWMKTENGADVLNDAYNASPTSMKAILKSFSSVPVDKTGRKIAVLGDVRELGPDSKVLHQGLAAALDPSKIEKVYLFGPEMTALYEALQENYGQENLFHEMSNHQILIERLKEDIESEDVVLVKSSLGVDLLQVVTGITGKETHNMLRKN